MKVYVACFIAGLGIVLGAAVAGPVSYRRGLQDGGNRADQGRAIAATAASCAQAQRACTQPVLIAPAATGAREATSCDGLAIAIADGVAKRVAIDAEWRRREICGD